MNTCVRLTNNPSFLKYSQGQLSYKSCLTNIMKIITDNATTFLTNCKVPNYEVDVKVRQQQLTTNNH